MTFATSLAFDEVEKAALEARKNAPQEVENKPGSFEKLLRLAGPGGQINTRG